MALNSLFTKDSHVYVHCYCTNIIIVSSCIKHVRPSEYVLLGLGTGEKAQCKMRITLGAINHVM